MANPPRPMPKAPPAHECDYCGRELQPGGAINCCGCGAPLRSSRITNWAGVLYEDPIEVTTMSDYERRYISPFISQPGKIKK